MIIHYAPGHYYAMLAGGEWLWRNALMTPIFAPMPGNDSLDIETLSDRYTFSLTMRQQRSWGSGC